MGFDKMKDQLSDAMSKNSDKLGDGIDKAADFVDDKTGGKHTDKIDSAADKAKGLLGQDNDDPDQPTRNTR
ncbi:antitoxin [Phytoactinopolyspora limicola]|uniref:antitoxin n=1 Tax=Phytoactinopolyspora limicola TaxID=2715536 RepID=UPI001408505A|nr:antitoxin [Phytoactinopolyspora limicola]